MNLYRIDTPDGPVSDVFGPCLIRSYRDACDRAHDEADRIGASVTLTRIFGCGHIKVSRVIHPGRGGF